MERSQFCTVRLITFILRELIYDCTVQSIGILIKYTEVNFKLIYFIVNGGKKILAVLSDGDLGKSILLQAFSFLNFTLVQV